MFPSPLEILAFPAGLAAREVLWVLLATVLMVLSPRVCLADLGIPGIPTLLSDPEIQDLPGCLETLDLLWFLETRVSLGCLGGQVLGDLGLPSALRGLEYHHDPDFLSRHWAPLVLAVLPHLVIRVILSDLVRLVDHQVP